tara:strand:- start:1235 stop:2134 length:900 start_codon:yes stop_codon:yes gene_type:complete
MKNFLLTLIILISLAFNTSFSIHEKNNAYKLQDHFVFIKTHIELIKNKECSTDCYNLFDIEKETKKINKALKSNPLLVGSGFVYDNNNNTKIITASHLCDKIKNYLSYRKDFNDNKVDLLQAIVDNKSLDPLAAIYIASNYRLDPVVTLYDFNGNTYTFKEILKQDKNKDLCSIKSNSVFGIPVKFSNANCDYGEEVVNISTSDGLYFPGAVPQYKGIYSGHVKNKRFRVFSEKAEISIYTIDISQGSSGSAVFSAKTKEICGIIAASLKGAKVSLGSSNNDIKKFINGDAGSRTQVQK